MDRDSDREPLQLIRCRIQGRDNGMVTIARARPLHLEQERKRQSAVPSSSRAEPRHRQKLGHAKAGTGVRVCQSSMYTNKPKRSRGKRGRLEPPTSFPVEEDADEASQNDFHPTIEDTSRFESLSLNDSSPALTDGAAVHADDMGSGLPDSTIMAPSAPEEALSPRSEEECKIDWYSDQPTFDNFEDAFAYLCETDKAAQAARDEARAMSQLSSSPDIYEDRSVLAPEQARPVPGPDQAPTIPAQERYFGSSKVRIAQNGKKWMSEEVLVAFQKYLERKDDLKELDYEFDELHHQCFHSESYYKTFHHFNFTVKMKEPGSSDWISTLYFAELKEIFGQKNYFCCPLEPYENGVCYACKNQGIDDLRHPVIGVYDRGSPNTVFPYMYDSDSSGDDDDEEVRDEAWRMRMRALGWMVG